MKSFKQFLNECLHPEIFETLRPNFDNSWFDVAKDLLEKYLGTKLKQDLYSRGGTYVNFKIIDDSSTNAWRVYRHDQKEKAYSDYEKYFKTLPKPIILTDGNNEYIAIGFALPS